MGKLKNAHWEIVHGGANDIVNILWVGVAGKGGYGIEPSLLAAYWSASH